MRCRKRLVQVDVHRINAEITRPHLADNRVEIRTIAVEIGARCVHRVSDRDDLRLKQPARIRVGQHDGCNIGAEGCLHRLHSNRAIIARGDRLDRVPHERRSRWVGAVRTLRHQYDAALRSFRVMRGLDREHAAQFAMRAGLR